MEKEWIERIVETEQRSKSNTKRIDEIDSEVKENRELTVAVKEIATEMKHLREDQADMNKRLKTIEEKPAKNWDKLIWIIITRSSNSYSGFFIREIWNIKEGKSYGKSKENSKIPY